MRTDIGATLGALVRPGAIQPAKYALVGVLNTVVDLTVLNLLFWAFSPGHSVGIAAINVASYGCGMVNSYLWNSRWTFASDQWHRADTAARFAAAMVLAWGLNTGTVVGGYAIATPLLADSVGLNVAKVAATAVSLAVGFGLCRWWVFKSEREGPPGP